MTVAFRVAAVQLALLSLGFGIPSAIGAAHAARTGSIWRFLGFPTNDPAGFEAWGLDLDVVPANLAFVGACLAGVVVAVLMWRRSTALVGAIAALVVVAVQAVFWWGFDLPFAPPGGVVTVVAVVVGLVLRGRRRRTTARMGAI